MATLERIRNRAGILMVIIIAMALFSFIFMDMFTGGGNPFGGSKYDIAEINGNTVPLQEYDAAIQELAEISKFSSGRTSLDEQSYERIKEQSWQKILRKYVLEEEYEELGVGVSSGELWDMIQGENIHPLIRQLFTDPETGTVNTIQIIRFLKSYEQDPSGNQKAYWLFLEDEIVNDRKYQKYSNLVRKGLYVTKAEAEAELSNLNRAVDFDFIVQRFNTIPDSLITITKGDLKAYYNDHQEDFKQSASRDIEYVSFEVTPSEEDRVATEKWITDIKGEFAQTENSAEFVNLNGDVSYIDRNYTPNDLPNDIASFSISAKEGDIYGPYFEEESFKLAKLTEFIYIADSVKARHILIRPDQQTGTYEPAIALADSLIQLIKSGRSFAELARTYGQDGSAQDGGDLGWFKEGDMIKSFSDSCFLSAKGEVKKTITQAGVHVIEVLDKSKAVKKAKIAFLERKLQPSSQTYQDVYSEASKFAGTYMTYDKFIEGIEKEGLTKKVANNLNEADKMIAGLESPRELIRSAFQVEKGAIITSKNNAIFEFGDIYVIGFVKEVREEGIAPLEQVQNQILVELKKDKKADQIKTEINSALQNNQDLESLASTLNLEIQDANSINFRSFSIPSVGVEPSIIATAANMQQDEISKPVQGSNGVYVIRIKSVNESEAGQDVTSQQERSNSQMQQRANFEAYNALQEAANVEDNRAKFY